MTSTERPQESTAGADAAERPRRRRSPLAVATVTAAVLIAGGGGAYFATSASGDGTDGRSGTAGNGGPPLLALDSAASGSGTGSGSASGTSPSEPPGIAPGEPDPSGVTYRAKGSLPDGPATARVYRTNGEVAAADVARLAEALGVPGTPRADGTAWKVGTEKDGSGPLLRVAKQAPGTWTFDRYRPSGSDNCLKGKSCPSNGGAPGEGAIAGGDPVSEAAAKRAAAPVLKALGQDKAALDARQLMGAIRVVNADPVIGGLPTYGWSTGIQVGADGQVTGGTGQLKAPEQSDSYPVIGADEALKELNASGDTTGRGRIGGCATPAPLEGGTSPEGGKPSAPCTPEDAPEAAPMVVEKAVFGLAMLSVDGRGALVPSWLFEVVPGGDAMPYTVTQPAVAPEFLAKPKPVPPQAQPRPGEELPGERVTSYSTEGRTLTLHFSGGVCSTYTASADESGTAVKVRLSESRPEPGTVCVAMAKFQTAKVTLDKPLGDRRVVEATTGDPLPLH